MDLERMGIAELEELRRACEARIQEAARAARDETITGWWHFAASPWDKSMRGYITRDGSQEKYFLDEPESFLAVLKEQDGVLWLEATGGLLEPVQEFARDRLYVEEFSSTYQPSHEEGSFHRRLVGETGSGRRIVVDDNGVVFLAPPPGSREFALELLRLLPEGSLRRVCFASGDCADAQHSSAGERQAVAWLRSLLGRSLELRPTQERGLRYLSWPHPAPES